LPGSKAQPVNAYRGLLITVELAYYYERFVANAFVIGTVICAYEPASAPGKT
jgi:hypothetical protein